MANALPPLVRLAQGTDRSRLAEIHVVGWRWAYRGIVSDQELFGDRTVVKGLEFWDRVLADHPQSALVYDDGLVKGFCLNFPCRDQDASEAWEVGALYVEPAFARSGVGASLVAGAEAHARDQGRTEMKLWVLAQNPRARSFYEAQGYQADGTSQVLPEWNNAVELRYTKRL